MKKKEKLKNILIILTIIIMIPVTLATLMWLILSIGVKGLVGHIVLLPIKSVFIIPIIKWGTFIVFLIWSVYGIIKIFNKTK